MRINAPILQNPELAGPLDFFPLAFAVNGGKFPLQSANLTVAKTPLSRLLQHAAPFYFPGKIKKQGGGRLA